MRPVEKDGILFEELSRVGRHRRVVAEIRISEVGRCGLVVSK